MKQTIYRVFALSLVLALTSCAGSIVSQILNDNTLIAGVAAYTATNQLLERSEDPASRAQRILLYTDAASEIVSADTPVSLDSVYDAIYALIDWQQIPPVDRPLIEDLLAAVRDRLAQEIEQSIALDHDTEVSLLHVIDRIRMAALFHSNG